MPSYRFCRPDDIPYLVRAVNECYDVHFPHVPPLTLERFREEMKSLDLWPSNCMVASSNAGPIAVLIGTKRVDEVAVLRLGMLPGHQRQGHGKHMLTSLAQKLAVLGPERLIAEVPRDLPGIGDFFLACGYQHEVAYTDYVREVMPADPVPEELLMPITVSELDDHELLEPGPSVAWERRRETLLNRKDEDLEGIAIASPERVEAFLLHRGADNGASQDVLALVAPRAPQRETLLGLLLRSLANQTELPIRLPKLTADEVPSSVLEALGFTAFASTDRYAGVAIPV